MNRPFSRTMNFAGAEMKHSQGEGTTLRARKSKCSLPFVQLEEIRRLNDSSYKLLLVTVLLFLATLAVLAVTILLLRHAA